MHKDLYLSLAAIVAVLLLGIFDRERRRMWLSFLVTIVVAVGVVAFVAWL